MPRPVAYSRFLMQLALQTQEALYRTLPCVALLAASEESPYALLTLPDGQGFLVLDRRTMTVGERIPLPPRVRRASDYVRFVFNPAGSVVCGWNPLDGSFATWSLSESRQLGRMDGEGQIPGAMAFLDDRHVALCDSNRIHYFSVTGDKKGTTRLTDDLMGVQLFTIHGAKPILVAGMVRKQTGGTQLLGMRIEEGVVKARGETARRAPMHQPRTRSRRSLHEIYNIPGSTQHSLILCEEERTDFLDESGEVVQVRYRTRLVAFDPSLASFHDGEVELEGRHCLELAGPELRLVDEYGRHRRVLTFPLRCEIADWRFEAQT
jgi:hypothetical protein